MKIAVKTFLRSWRPTINVLALLLAGAVILAWLVGFLAGLVVIWFGS